MEELTYTEHPDTALSDAQLAAQWAARAFQAGRFALGEAVGKIALQAHIAQLHASSTGLTISPHVPTPIHAAASTGFFEPVTAKPDVLDSRRCLAPVRKDGVMVPCDQGIYHLSAPEGDGTTWWEHADQELDLHHYPMSQEGQTTPAYEPQPPA